VLGSDSKGLEEEVMSHKDGKVVPLRPAFGLASAIPPSGANPIHVLAEDLSALRSAEAALQASEAARHELARRLTEAQEEERTRIARELHDDIGQSLAILRIQLLRADQPVSDGAGRKHRSIQELCDDLKLIINKVSRLSHQLHSAELEYLGLAVAVRGHCREFSEQYKISVECSCEDIPENLDRDLALNLLRVVQEALHNAAKHSKATSIRVTLRGSGAHLSLLITDDGVGFDVGQAKLAVGLGLISMREPVHLAGGEFKITSAPGTGAHIAARVPLLLRPSGLP